MAFYIDEEVKISQIYQYDNKKYKEENEFYKYILAILLAVLISIGISFLIKTILDLSLIFFLIILSLLLIPLVYIFSFLFSAHNEGRNRYFAYSKDSNRLFAIEKLSDEGRKAIGLTFNNVKYEKIDLELANEIVNSNKALSFYVYEILKGKSFLISPQGIGYKLKIKKKIRYGKEVENICENKKINISNRYNNFKNLIGNIENLG